MPDRLAELKRQRALVAEHLQWLDREIAAADSSAVTPADPTPKPLVAAPLPAPLPAETEIVTDPALLALQEEERHRGEFSKSGCWIVFSALLLLAVGTLTAVIMLKYR